MANNADNTVIAASGSLNFGPVGTTMPTDVTTALNAAFIDAGFLTEDGITVTPGVEFNEIMAWQSRYPIRRTETGRSLELSATLREVKKDNFILAMGGGTINTASSIHTYTPPTNGAVDERAAVVYWLDGTKRYRMRIPKCVVTSLGEFKLVKDDTITLDITISVISADGVAPFTIISDDPAWAA